MVDREGAPVYPEEGAQQVERNVRLPTHKQQGVALTAALFGVVIAWAWAQDDSTLWFDWGKWSQGWFVGNMVCE